MSTVKTKSPRTQLQGRWWSVPLGWAVVLITVLVLWQLSAEFKWTNPIFTGRPTGIAQEFWLGITGPLLSTDAVMTTVGAVTGWLGASVLAIIAAFALTESPYLYRVLDPFITALNSLPRVALAPLFLLWLGIGMTTKIAMAASLAFFVVFSATIAGIQGVNSDHTLVARTMGASKSEVFRKIVIPSAVPSIFAGLELGFIYGMLGTVAGEMLAGSNGLGVRLQYFASSFNMNGYFAALLLLVIITMIIAAGLRRTRLWLLRWQNV